MIELFEICNITGLHYCFCLELLLSHITIHGIEIPICSLPIHSTGIFNNSKKVDTNRMILNLSGKMGTE